MVAGRSEYLDAIDGGMWSFGDASYPQATTTFFAGTFSKHPLTMVASCAVLKHLEASGASLQLDLNDRTAELAGELNELFARHAAPIRVVHFGSLFRFVFKGNLDIFFYHLMEEGVHTWEGRTCFLSTAHEPSDVSAIVGAVERSVAALEAGGFLSSPGKATSASSVVSLPTNILSGACTEAGDQPRKER